MGTDQPFDIQQFAEEPTIMYAPQPTIYDWAWYEQRHLRADAVMRSSYKKALQALATDGEDGPDVAISKIRDGVMRSTAERSTPKPGSAAWIELKKTGAL